MNKFKRQQLARRRKRDKARIKAMLFLKGWVKEYPVFSEAMGITQLVEKISSRQGL